MSTYAQLIRDYFPPVSYDLAAGGQAAERAAEAAVLDAVNGQAGRVTGAFYPPTAAAYITRWETVLDIEPPEPGNYARRVADVLARLNAVGGLSIPYFIGLAAAAGYSITIAEPQPFRAGVNRAGDRLAAEDIMWVWRVDVAAASQTVWYFRAGAGGAGGRLSSYSDAVIEALFKRLKPAHTAVRFTYR
ncbi:uncharacterized protein YmfQ (DUF2313 family) [Neisseria sp. HSC-16F19]|nr:putative phage tail protein [Neisseria sp. HSC-16F19]MCP2041791.1 uncharacterized protein YmfQ (DUF2313 family) [Neisseria sp. HSC-16F19]